MAHHKFPWSVCTRARHPCTARPRARRHPTVAGALPVSEKVRSAQNNFSSRTGTRKTHREQADRYKPHRTQPSTGTCTRPHHAGERLHTHTEQAAAITHSLAVRSAAKARQRSPEHWNTVSRAIRSQKSRQSPPQPAELRRHATACCSAIGRRPPDPSTAKTPALDEMVTMFSGLPSFAGHRRLIQIPARSAGKNWSISELEGKMPTRCEGVWQR